MRAVLCSAYDSERPASESLCPESDQPVPKVSPRLEIGLTLKIIGAFVPLAAYLNIARTQVLLEQVPLERKLTKTPGQGAGARIEMPPARTLNAASFD